MMRTTHSTPTTRRPIRTRVALAASLIGGLLVGATAPVAQAGEVAADDFRVSNMGPDVTAGFEAQQARTAYDATNDQFLVVWRGDDEGDGQTEIYAQLIDAVDNTFVLSSTLLVAQIGTAGDPSTDAVDPAVAWNSTTGDFVVVYAGDDTTDIPLLSTDTFEIYAQGITAAGALDGTPLRVSDMGATDADTSFDARQPDIAYNADDNEFLVVWQGDDDTTPLLDDESEIFGQRIDGTAGAELGTNDVRLSDIGVDGATTTDARNPSVAYDSANTTYLVVFDGNDDDTALGDFDVYGQLATPALVETGTDFAISTTGNEALDADVAADTDNGGFLVAWQGDGAVDNEFEIYASTVSAAGAVGTDARVTTMGPDGEVTWIAKSPALAYDALADEFVAVFVGDDDTGSAVDDHFEVYSQRLTAAGALSGTMERLSTMGNETTASTAVSHPDITYGSTGLGRLGVFWSAENSPETVAGESEIWGQLIAPLNDLQITASVVGSPAVAPGGAVQLELAFENLGPIDMVDLVIAATIPTGITIDTIANTGPAIGLQLGTTYMWDLAALDSGASGTITLTGSVDSDATDGPLVSSFSLTSAALLDDPMPNNSGTVTVTVDAPPAVMIEQAGGDPTNDTTIDFDVVFSEDVTGFDAAADVTLGGTALPTTAVIAGSGSVYTVSVSGMSTDGTVIASIAAGIANDADQGLAGNTASTSIDNTVTFDTTGPTVTIDQGASQADPTNGSSIVFDVEFSEPANGFGTGDVTLSGAAGATTATVAGTGTDYTVTVTGMTGDGDVVASINAGVATDAAGNANVASTSTDGSVTYDATGPTVTINQGATQGDPTNQSPIVFDVVFSEPVTGFSAAGVALTSTSGTPTVSNVSGSGTNYTVSVSQTPTGGTVTATVTAGAASDLAGNINVASSSTDNSVTADTTPPVPTLSQRATQSNPTNESTIVFDLVFSEPVTGVVPDDLRAFSPAGVTLPGVTGSGAAYTVTVPVTAGTGDVSVTLRASVVSDPAGNRSAGITSETVAFDTQPPTVTIEQGATQTDPGNGTSVVFDVVFSETVTGFASGDITLSGTAGATTATVSGAGATYTVTVTGMTGEGTVVASIAAGVAQDALNNLNAASTSVDNSVTFDTTAPSVTIEQGGIRPDPTNVASGFEFDVVFSEPVTGFDKSDVTLTFTEPIDPGFDFDVITIGNGTDYIVRLFDLPADNTVVATIGAGAATDAAGNMSLASTSVDNSMTYDATRPTVTVEQGASQADPTNSSSVVYDVVFSEPVTGFAAGNVTLSGTANATTVVVGGSGTDYTVTVTGMTNDGTIVTSIAAGEVQDPAGNTNLASTSIDDSVTYDTTAPAVTIDQGASQADPGNGSSIVFDVQFSETVTTFTDADVSLSGTAGATSATVTGSGADYTVTVTGMVSDGTVTASIGAGTAPDPAGNANAASTSNDNTVTVDMTIPTVTVEQAAGQADPTNTGSIDFTITFSTPVTGFAAGDVTISGTAGASTATLAGSGTTYTATVTDMTSDGTVVATVAAGVANDTASNSNDASTSIDNSVTYDSTAPTSSVALAAGQTTPTNSPSIEFVVSFDELVTGFDASNVTLSGAAGAATVAVTPTGTDYTVVVSGLTDDGAVTVTVSNAGVIDTAGNAAAAPSPASATVIFIGGDPAPLVNDAPTVVVPADSTIELGQAVSLSGAGAVTVDDVDALDADLTVTVTAAGSTIAVGDTSALTASSGGGTQPLVLTGDLPSLDAALGTVTITPLDIGDALISVAVDDLGNTPGPAATATGSFTVTAVDTTDPVIDVPGPITVAADPGLAGATVEYGIAVDDNGTRTAAFTSSAVSFTNDGSARLVAGGALTCTPPSGSFFPIGSTTVNCTAVDTAGNTASASFLVTVTDDQAPVLLDPGRIVAATPSGTGGPVNYVLPTSSDNSGSVTVTCVPPPGSTFAIGITTITCVASDGNGNTSTVTFELDVMSSILPATGGGLGLATLALQLLLLGLIVFGASRLRPRRRVA